MFSDLGRSTFEQDAHKIRPLVMERRQLTKGIAAGATTVYINSLPRNVLDNQGYIVIDAYTSKCELRRFTRDGKVLTVDALTYAHNKHDEVIFLDACVLSPLWFGARGNGTTDDTDMLQATIDALPTTGGAVYGDGIFKITDTINMKSRTRLEGPVGGYPSANTGTREGFKLAWAGANNGTMLSYVGCQFCELQGVNLSGGLDDGITGVTAILIDSVNNPNAYGYDFRNFGISECHTGIKLNTSGTSDYQSSEISLRNFDISDLDLTSGYGIYTNSRNVSSLLIEEGRFMNMRYCMYFARIGFANIVNCIGGFMTERGDFITAISHDNIKIDQCQAEGLGSGTAGYFLHIPSSAAASTLEPIVMISSITDLETVIAKDRNIVTIANHFNRDFTLSGDSARVISMGDLFSGSYDFKLTGVNPAIDRTMCFNGATNYIGIDHYVQTISGKIREKQTVQAWVTHETQTATLGLVPSNVVFIGARIEVTEAWNSDGADEISIGVDAAHTYFVNAVDVATTGTKTATLNALFSGSGFEASATTVVAYYVNGGSEPSTGRAIVTIEYIQVDDEPA